jgi:hypothetical protein
MGPCCGKHLSSLLRAISSEPYSLLHLLWTTSLRPSSRGSYYADNLFAALFLRQLLCGQSLSDPPLEALLCGQSLSGPLLGALPYRHTPYIAASL